MRCKLNTQIGCLLIESAALCACLANDADEKHARWIELEKYGSVHFQSDLEPRHAITNSMATTTIAHDEETDRKWFCEVVSFSMPTNDVEAYVSWLHRKTRLITRTFYSQNTEASIESWRQLAMFLADMRAKRGEGESGQFMREHRGRWLSAHPENTFENLGQWKKAYMIARSYRSAWSRAAIAIEHMIEQVAGSMPPERRKMFMDTLISKTKVVPDWYSKEMKSVEEGQKGLSESLSAIVERSHSGESLDMNEVHLTMKKATLIYDEKTRESLTCNFRAALFAVNMQIVDSAKKSAIIHAVIDAARALWTEMQNANLPKQECWQLRLQALSWLHSLLKQLEPDKKAESRCFNAEYAQKRNLFLSVRQIYQRLLKTYGDELKSVWYTPEFRAWCLKEIEKIIGRPLTDDDPMFNDEVLNRRKVREQDEKRKGAK